MTATQNVVACVSAGVVTVGPVPFVRGCERSPRLPMYHWYVRRLPVAVTDRVVVVPGMTIDCAAIGVVISGQMLTVIVCVGTTRRSLPVGPQWLVARSQYCVVANGLTYKSASVLPRG